MSIKTWFSSDWHLGHHNILKYDNRPFKNIEIHDQTIIDNHNSVVGPNDHFYFLGDFGLTDSRYVRQRLSELNGIKFFIKGNHDKHDTVKAYEKYGTYLGEKKTLVINGQGITLDHFAGRTWDKSHKDNWMLYGHDHGSLDYTGPAKTPTPWGKSMDVCIILNNYFPFEFEEIKRIMDKRPSLKHHDQNERE